MPVMHDLLPYSARHLRATLFAWSTLFTLVSLSPGLAQEDLTVQEVLDKAAPRISTALASSHRRALALRSSSARPCAERTGVITENSTYSLPSLRRLKNSPCQERPWVSVFHRSA